MIWPVPVPVVTKFTEPQVNLAVSAVFQLVIAVPSGAGGTPLLTISTVEFDGQLKPMVTVSGRVQAKAEELEKSAEIESVKKMREPFMRKRMIIDFPFR
jgi:hypothetical protein